MKTKTFKHWLLKQDKYLFDKYQSISSDEYFKLHSANPKYMFKIFREFFPNEMICKCLEKKWKKKVKKWTKKNYNIYLD